MDSRDRRREDTNLSQLDRKKIEWQNLMIPQEQTGKYLISFLRKALWLWLSSYLRTVLTRKSLGQSLCSTALRYDGKDFGWNKACYTRTLKKLWDRRPLFSFYISLSQFRYKNLSWIKGSVNNKQEVLGRTNWYDTGHVETDSSNNSIVACAYWAVA
jgi:hypothetical protein